MIRCLLVALAALSVFSVPSEARRAEGFGAVTRFCGDRVCGWAPEARRGTLRAQRKVVSRETRRKVHHKIARTPGILAGGAFSGARPSIRTRIVSHPSGCPRVAFCGCGLSVHFFGKPVRAGGLAVAAEWGRRFQRAALAAGMAVVTRHGGHVYGVLEVLSPQVVLAWDANSGGRRTQIHRRTVLPGDIIVNPLASRLASR